VRVENLKMQSKSKDAVSLGEVMIESIFHVDAEPPINSTVVVKGQMKIHELGGAAINVAWYLGSLGKSVRLVAPISCRQIGDLSEEAGRLKVDLSGLMKVKGDTDHLITLLSPEGHRSIYVLGEIPSDLKLTTLKQVKAHRVIIMNGGRHREIREIFRDITLNCPDKLIVFNPSYAVYEYANDELTEIMERCDICFFNEDEYGFVKKQGEKDIRWMPRLALIVTRSSKGAWMFANNRQHNFKSLLNRNGVFLGAGDACLAGFISGLLDELSLEQALQRGMRLASLVVERNEIRIGLSKADMLSLVRV
jgi:sugar/nucleoside kinase (ribokinase family)